MKSLKVQIIFIWQYVRVSYFYVASIFFTEENSLAHIVLFSGQLVTCSGNEILTTVKYIHTTQ